MILERIFKKCEFILVFILFFYIINLILYFYKFDIINKIGFIIISIFYLYYFYKFRFFKNLKKRTLIYVLLFFYAFITSNFIYIKIHFDMNYEAITLKKIKQIYLFSGLFVLLFLILLKKLKFHTKIRYFYSIFILTFFFSIFYIYLFKALLMNLIDTYYTKFLPYSVLYEKNININELDNTRYITKDFPELYYPGTRYITGKDGNAYPVFPLLPGFIHGIIVFLEKLLGLPIVSLNYKEVYINSIYGWVLHYFEPHQVESINASLIAVLTSYLFYKLLTTFRIRKIKALFYTFIYSLASIHFSISATNLWQHTFIEFFNLILLLNFINFIRTNNNKFLFFIGILEGILFYIRPTTILISVILNLFFIFLNDFKKRLELKNTIYSLSIIFLSAILIIVPLGILNVNIYDNFLGGYGKTIQDKDSTDVIFLLDKPFLNFLGLLFSPNYGFFVFHPYILVAFIYFIYDRFKNKQEQISREKQLMIYSSFFCILIYLIFYSFNQQWTGFYNYGTRMLTDVLVYFFILLVFSIEKLTNTAIKYLFHFFVLISLIIQFYGNFSLNLVGDWYCDTHQRKFHYKDVEKNVWDIEDPLFFHKVYYRSKPLYFEKVIYPGYKMCSLYFMEDEKESIFLKIDKQLVEKHKNITPFFLRFKNNQNDLPEGDLLFSYYFFTDKKYPYCLRIDIFNPKNQEQAVTIYIINSEGNIYPHYFTIYPRENLISIPLQKTSRNFFYVFSNNYSEFLLRYVKVYKNHSCKE